MRNAAAFQAIGPAVSHTQFALRITHYPSRLHRRPVAPRAERLPLNARRLSRCIIQRQPWTALRLEERMMESVRLGYVGAGWMAQRVHLPNFASLPDCQV